jgi:hypothetical protein
MIDVGATGSVCNGEGYRKVAGVRISMVERRSGKCLRFSVAEVKCPGFQGIGGVIVKRRRMIDESDGAVLAAAGVGGEVKIGRRTGDHDAGAGG